MIKDFNRSPWLICTWSCACKKYKRWLGMSIKTPGWFVHIGSLTVHTIECKPLASIGDTYCYLGKASQIIMMRRNTYCLVRFQGSHFEILSIADWSDHKTLNGLPWNSKVFTCKLVWFADWYKSYASSSIYPFDANQEVDRYLVGVKHLTRSGMCHLFFETYHFYCWTEESLRSVLLSQASPTQREID
jgi:hypothetical protein